MGVGTRQCRVLTVSNINSDATGVDISYFPLNLCIPVSFFIVAYSASHGIAKVYFTAFVHLLEMLTSYIPPLAR
jgi:hypothetical protein